jgi:hypothetical protein
MDESISLDTFSSTIIIIAIIAVILYTIILMFIEKILDDDLNDIHFKLPKKKKRSKSL